MLEAARALFTEQGTATTIREVAARAGVSRATVETTFGTKAALLGAVVDVALAGDDEPVAILDRPWVAELMTLAPADFLRGAGAAFGAGAARLAPVLGVLDGNGPRDPAITALADRLRRQRQVMATWVVDQVVAQGALSPDLTVETAVDTVMIVLDPAVHRRLLIERHWSSDQLSAWLGRSLQRLLLADPV